MVADIARSETDGMAMLSRFLVDEGTLDGALRRIADLACETAPADFAGIAMLGDGRGRTGAFTDPVASELGKAQDDTGEGPSLEAFHTGKVLTIDDTSSDERWPAFCESAAKAGINSVLSLPLMARGEKLGALSLYSRSTAAFDRGTAERMSEFSQHASIVLTNVQLYWDARQLGENLSQAMRSRAMIDHAIGIIMAQGGRTPDEAFQVLVRASQRENRKLRDIASDLVHSAQQRPDGSPSEAAAGPGGSEAGPARDLASEGIGGRLATASSE